jgi:hypothetical protein
MHGDLELYAIEDENLFSPRQGKCRPSKEHADIYNARCRCDARRSALVPYVACSTGRDPRTHIRLEGEAIRTEIRAYPLVECLWGQEHAD